MGDGNEIKSVALRPYKHCPARFGNDSPAAILWQQTVSEVKRPLCFKVYISYGNIVFFQANGIGVSLFFKIFRGIADIIKFLCPFYVLNRKPRKISIRFPITEYFKQRAKILFVKSAQDKRIRFYTGRVFKNHIMVPPPTTVLPL